MIGHAQEAAEGQNPMFLDSLLAVPGCLAGWLASLLAEWLCFALPQTSLLIFIYCFKLPQSSFLLFSIEIPLKIKYNLLWAASEQFPFIFN